MLLKTAKRVVVFVTGMTVVLIGIGMLVTPGPACVVVPAGLAILSTEFVWARYVLRKGKEAGTRGFEIIFPKKASSDVPQESSTDSSADLADRRIEPPA